MCDVPLANNLNMTRPTLRAQDMGRRIFAIAKGDDSFEKF
jgi:hypothetical protein